MGDKLKELVKWLPLAKCCYSTNIHSYIKLTPFEVVYGYSPPKLLPYISGIAQEWMKRFTNYKRTERQFEIRD